MRIDRFVALLGTLAVFLVMSPSLTLGGGDAFAQAPPQCSDGADNDGDDLVDVDDPGCANSDDNDESDDPGAEPECSDGADNDSDGKTDFGSASTNDPGCSSADDDDETDPPTPECSDGADNDEDSATDHPADSGCESPSDEDETRSAGITSSTGPLTRIQISEFLNCAVNHVQDEAGEFFGETACGTFLASAGTLYSPADIPAGESAEGVAFTPVSQSAVSGSGTSSDPYQLVTVVDAGPNLRITESDYYVVGQESYRTDVKVENRSAVTQSAILYRAGDCYLQDSDTGFGLVSGESVACQAATTDPQGNAVRGDRIQQWSPLSAGSRYFEAGFDEVWSTIGAQKEFPNTCRCNENIDNGAGLSWALTIPATGTATRSHLTTFSPAGQEPATTTKTADSSTATVGSSDGYTITVRNTSSSAITLNSITDTLPRGFSYTAGSSTGVTNADPQASGQTLVWQGPFTVPASGRASLHFSVTVSSTPGEYFNNAGAESSERAVVPTGDTAKITVTAPPQCSDRLDNDSDGRANFPDDQGCDSPGDTSEAPDPPQCSDRLDNDSDGRANFPDDQGCDSPGDDSEAPDPPQCSDRLDNDGDGRGTSPTTRAPRRPGLRLAGRRLREAPDPPQCSDRLDNDSDGRANFPDDQGCDSPGDDSEAPDPPQCSDRLDNDGDGRGNFPDDQGCDSPGDDSEAPDPPQCSDRLDNDGDGRGNFPDDQGCDSPGDDSEDRPAAETASTTTPTGGATSRTTQVAVPLRTTQRAPTRYETISNETQ